MIVAPRMREESPRMNLKRIIYALASLAALAVSVGASWRPK